jgi:hypothetical protein
MWRDRFHRWAWRLAAVGMVLAASLVLVGGIAAGTNRTFSDLLVLAGFGALIPSVMLGWLGLPAASNPTSFATSFPEEPLQ